MALKKAERLANSISQREVIRAKASNPVQSKMYGVLGIDSIIQGDQDAFTKADQKNVFNDHAYGLDAKLFTPEYERKEGKRNFDQFMNKMDYQTKLCDKMRNEQVNYKTNYAKLKSASKSGVIKKKFDDNDAQTIIDEIYRKKNKLNIRIGELN